MSLDAPLVAVVWQRWWERSVGIRPFWGCDLVLGLGVWMIYLSDRLADTMPSPHGDRETARHAFYRRQHRPLRAVVLAVFLGVACLAPSVLPLRQFLPGLGLLSLTAIYFWLIHRRGDRAWSRIVPKEAVVGGMFAVGTGFFALEHGRQVPAEVSAALPLFGALCFFNCALITKWERNPQDLREFSSLLNAFPGLAANLGVGCVCLALVTFTVAVFLPHGAVLAPVAVAALLLAVLDKSRRRFSSNALRVLADAVLLTPWCCLTLPLHSS